MKRLLIMRHGKAEQPALGQPDHERRLRPRGIDEARRLGRHLRRLDVQPDRIFCSTATRTRETLSALLEGWAADDPPAEYLHKLYLAEPEDVYDVIRGTDEGISMLLIVGHEPFCSTVTGGLVGRSSSGATIHFPTAAMACIQISVRTWGEVYPGAGTLAWHLTPKLIP